MDPEVWQRPFSVPVMETGPQILDRISCVFRVDSGDVQNECHILFNDNDVFKYGSVLSDLLQDKWM